MFNSENKRRGCIIGCLISVVVSILSLVVLALGIYYFLSYIKKAEPGDYFQVDKEAGLCLYMKEQMPLGDILDVEFEVLGKSGDSCVVFGKIIEIKELPEEAKAVPKFVLDAMLKDLTMECLVPQEVYLQGIENVGGYIGENLTTVCKGPLFDIADKLGIDLTTVPENDINKQHE